jgi:YD repeat-containing protein
MSLRMWRCARRSLLSRIGGAGFVALLGTVLVPGVAAAQYSCAGVGIVDPLSGVAVVDPVTGGIGCVVIPGSSMTLNGVVNESANLSDPLGTTRYTYDGNGNRLAGDSGGSIATTTVYDADERLTSSSNPLGTSSYTYDQGGEPTSNTGASGTVTRYDTDGNRLQDTRDAGNAITTRTEYDSQGRVTEITDAGGNPIDQFFYDSHGNLVEIIDATTGTTTYTYDSQNRVISETNGSETTSYTYDTNGDLVSETDPLGNVTTTTYDTLNRLISDTDTQGTTDFVFDQTVPEPGSLALLGGGLVALFGARRRWRRAVPPARNQRRD